MSLLRALTVSSLFPAVVAAQEPSPPTLGAVVVVAERAATPINHSAAAITRLTAADLSRLPYASVADVLRLVPGITVVDFNGSGRDPQLMTRGFYGGGEAEYVVVLVDGRPVNLAHNGTVTWETLPPVSAIESIEIVRGSASAMHGDAAVAGVINIVTRANSRAETRWRTSAEFHAGLSASVDLMAPMDRRDLVASLGFDRTNGFRQNSERTSASARGTMRLTRQIRGSLRAGWRDFEEPGPLLESLLNDGSESDPRFSRDGGRDRDAELSLQHDGVLGAGGTLTTAFRMGARRADLTRTLPLSPDFGDTRERQLRTTTTGLTTQADLTPTILPLGIARVSAGLSADLGTLGSRYFSTDENGLANEDGRGDGRRGTLAAFLHLVARPTDIVRWSLGIRGDYLRDSFEPQVNPPATQVPLSSSHVALSPKLGVNIRYAAAGHFWMSASRTFKAPTLDQLYDQRPIPIPFPPFSVTTSNPDLEPQRGTSAEAGLYQELAVASASIGLSVTVYTIEMKDELDFDIQTFRYVNISRSRHRGTEAAISLSRGFVSAHASVALQDAVSRAGVNSGKRLKAVPGQVYSLDLTARTGTKGSASISLARTADMYIDDANTQRIPSWTRVDAQVAYPLGTFDVVAGSRNLLDKRYNSTAFLDPSGSGQAYVYPAAGRVVTLGMRYGR